ncbi:hypothetical protein Hanom_Chr03g00254871 [Helianthus anomalus]
MTNINSNHNNNGEAQKQQQKRGIYFLGLKRFADDILRQNRAVAPSGTNVYIKRVDRSTGRDIFNNRYGCKHFLCNGRAWKPGIAWTLLVDNGANVNSRHYSGEVKNNQSEMIPQSSLIYSIGAFRIQFLAFNFCFLADSSA